MKGLIGIAALIGVLAQAAHADLSDSGNLTIGGQAVVGGTMTVSGSSFSVGGYGFSISGGSATVTGQLKVPAAGIQWADGSTSTSAAAGSPDAAMLSGTQSFTGGNTFTSTAAFTFSPSSNTAPAANALYSKFIPAAIAVFEVSSTSVTTYGAVNISSITRLSTGDYRLNFATSMSGTHYACICSSPQGGASVCSMDTSPARTQKTIDFLIQNWNGTTFVSADIAGHTMAIECWDFGNTRQ